MSQLTGDERAAYVRGVFSRIASRYDTLNRLMTGGQDIRWRRVTIRRAGLSTNSRLLDLGTGTGDLAREALRQEPFARIVAADFTIEMMRLGQGRGPLPWAAADALRLPFPGNSFDAVVSGFLMRNVGDLSLALAEQFRVLKPGGRLVILETTRPRPGPFSPLIRLHMRFVIPLLGGLVSGFREAYHYLPDSSEHFLEAEEFASQIAAAGFRNVGFIRRMLGTIAIHWGEK